MEYLPAPYNHFSRYLTKIYLYYLTCKNEKNNKSIIEVTFSDNVDSGFINFDTRVRYTSFLTQKATS